MPTRTVDGARLWYERHEGPAPALVFVHGLGCDHTDWRLQVERFRGAQAIVVVDQRGHGRSDTTVGSRAMERLGRDLADLLNELDLGPAILVGHSMGCRVVIEAADLQPGRVAGLVLADGSRIAAAGDDGAGDRLERAAREAGVANMLRGIFEQMFLDGADAAEKEAVLARAATMPDGTAIDLLRGMVEFDAMRVDAVLQRIEVPVLVVQSTHLDADRVRVPLAENGSTPWTEQVAGVVPDATVQILTGAGHFNMLDQAEVFGDAVERFAARCGSGA